MNYKFMIDTAIDVIRKRYDKRHNPLPGDTVCVICAGNGNVYSASNEYVVKDNVSENVHAEINALKKMQADGLTKIKAVTVFNSCTITPILPCNGCITFITSLNPENAHALVVTPNGNIPITEVGRYAAPDRSQSRMAGSYYSVYTSLPASNRGASLYTGPSGQPFSQTSRSITSNNRPVYYRSSQSNMNMSAMSGRVGVSYASRNVNAAAGRTPVRTNQNGVNNLLKNKLSTLFEDDDAEESKNL
jgi:cytidine deaminase